MDWFRRIFGYSDQLQKDGKPFKDPTWEEILENRNNSDRSQKDANPFRDPSWEEILGNRNHSDRFQATDDLFSGSFYNEDLFTHPKEFEDSFTSVFGQMDDMFRQLNLMFQGFHEHQDQMMITDVPGSHVPSERRAPRDFLLKVPDSKQSDDSNNFPERQSSDQPHSPYFGPIHPHHGPEDENDDEELRSFDSFGDFTIFDDIFKSFGGIIGRTPGGFSDFDAFPDRGMDSRDHSRESVMKKEDSDLDSRISGDVSQMLKEGPKYESPTRSGSDHSNIVQPETHQPQPRIHQIYRSKSVVRIRQPDGSIEETTKYVDSSGREEVIVTRTQPDGGRSQDHPLLPDQGGPDGPGEHPQAPFHPSFFSRIFTR